MSRRESIGADGTRYKMRMSFPFILHFFFFLDDLIDLIGQDAPPPSPSLSYAVQCDMCVVVSASWWSSKHPLHNCRQPTLMGTCIYSCYAHIYPLFDFMSMFVQTYPSQMIRLEQLSSELWTPNIRTLHWKHKHLFLGFSFFHLLVSAIRSSITETVIEFSNFFFAYFIVVVVVV